MQTPGRSFGWRPVAAVVVVALLCATPGAFAAGPKVIGTVTFVGREGLDSVPIVGFAWTTRSTATPGAGGGGAGKATFDPFHVVKAIDATSAALFDLQTRGNKIPEVHVDVALRRGTTASYVLSNVLILGNERRTPDGGGPALQDLSLSATAVRETVISPGGTVTTCFDTETNLPCE